MDKNMLKSAIMAKAKDRHVMLNLEHPRTIQDKINWMKLNDVTPLKSKCADKIKIHEYCKEKLGKDICIPIIKVYNSPDEIKLNELPDQFVMKCNHGYNMNLICSDKKNLDEKNVISIMKNWLTTDFGKKSGQLHYSGIDRKCFVETYMSDDKQKESLYDYKFWCFNGEPKFYTINDGHGHGDILYYGLDGEVLDFYGVLDKNPDLKFEKPSKFDEMVNYARTLSQDFKFVRVDFYEINGQVYLGELTFTPGNGFFKYKNRETDIMVGDMLKL